MPSAPSISLPRRSDPTVRALALAWRRLTGGTTRGQDPARRTLIACSGGGDSSGLTLALAAATSEPAQTLVIAHIIHDLRPESQALADRDTAQALAAALGIPFVERRIAVRAAGKNAEAAARRLRYEALASIAREQGCPYLATAHHADDQLETLLMGMLRGSGPRGMSGVVPRRRLKSGPILIRPALTLSREDLQRLCLTSAWTWSEDATNTDTTRLRAALRHTVLPTLKTLRPGASQRAARGAALIADAAAVVNDRAKALLKSAASLPSGNGLTWDRTALRTERPIVLGTLLKSAASKLLQGHRRDRLGSGALDPMIRATRTKSSIARQFSWSGLRLTIQPSQVQLSTVPDA